MDWPTTVHTRGAKEPSRLSSLVFLVDFETIYVSPYSRDGGGEGIELGRGIQSIEYEYRRDVGLPKCDELAFDEISQA